MIDTKTYKIDDRDKDIQREERQMIDTKTYREKKDG